MNVQMERAVPDGFVYEQEQNIMHGRYGSTEFLIVPRMAEGQFQIQLYVDVESSRGKGQFLSYLQAFQQRHSFVKYAGYNGKDMVSIFVASQGQEDKENLTIAVSEIASKCEENGVHNCCSYCGNARPLRPAAVDRVPALICQECDGRLSGSGSVQKKENLPLGIIGAILGTLVGSVLWVVLGQVGFIAGIAGYVIVFCGMKGYGILGRELSKAGIVICVILSFLMIAGAEFVSLAITIYNEMGGLFAPTIWDAFGWIPEMMKESELALAVAKDLVIGYALAIWASYASVKNTWRQVGESHMPHTIERF